ncbi:hypothetical protein [Shimia sp.]|uniref:hypothetical protein n=1 Tax=Shimia sp. TaxID=1954381 RepID=UPI003B8CAAAC
MYFDTKYKPTKVAMMNAYKNKEGFAGIEAEIYADNEWLRNEFAADFELLTKSQISDGVDFDGVLCLDVEGRDYYPGFQFDDAGMPFALLAQVLSHLKGRELSNWQSAFWLVSPENSLDGDLPVDLIHAGDERVIAAAESAYGMVEG